MTDVCHFVDESKQPNDSLLSTALGGTYGIWKEICSAIAEEYGPVVDEWKYYGIKNRLYKEIVHQE